MKSPTRSIVVMCTAALVGGTGGAVIATEAVGGGTQTVTAAATSTPAAVNRTVANTTGALTAGQIYAQSRDSVAFITATTSGSSPGGAQGAPDGLGGLGGGQGGSSSAGTATGSGFVVSSDGYVVTNAHVIDGADSVKVKIGDGDTLTAKVVGVDQSTDLALLKVSAPKALTPLELAQSSDVQVGDSTFAIGNPYGLSRTLTTGVVSALHRSIESPNGYAITGVLQTDAAINPGNSGGPLLDDQGRVIGVNSQIATSSTSSDGSSGGNVGIGFAVPSDTVSRIVQQLRTTGTAKHAYLGVGTADAAATGEDGVGATVASVATGGPAADAGLKAGDVITKVGDTTVTDTELLGAAVDTHQPGEQVEVQYTRGGDRKTAKVTLGTRPDSAARATSPTAP
ncbi:S1C family serine protease [Patulibacter sp.]|uniref:S1C family serine protease n=1 Tax=Patulibacter sp. TaxID=1912859 RepID=UPI002721AAD2|nr:trypsin-like peptidase domain-containing protein [Patulibacter sp.]MDO9409324.1 trypsin-like peptidase domain-containing protein [Patulibacter sp.]